MRELEALRGDVSNAAKKVLPMANGVPKPSIVPPLEDYNERPHPEPAPSAPLTNSFNRPPQAQSSFQPPHTAGIPSQNGFIPHRPTGPSFYSNSPGQSPPPSPFPQTPVGRQDPLSAASSRSFAPTQPPMSPSASQFARQQQHVPPQSPGAGPSSPALRQSTLPSNNSNEPPLGGHFVDGTKSMFVAKTSTGPRPSPLSFSSSVSNVVASTPSAPFDPLRSDSYPVSLPSADAANRAVSQQLSRPQETDPLGNIRPHQMSASMRVQPTRPRLDPREAASKLANMF